jgi:single-strand DNA-binding protein
MKSYNNVTLIGRAVRDPDFKDTSSANARVQFTLAVDRPYKDAEGKHPTDFLNVVAWGKLAEICHDYIQKGCLVLVSGRIQSRSYAAGAETKWITEVIADSVNILEYRQAKVTAEEKKEVRSKKKAA